MTSNPSTPRPLWPPSSPEKAGRLPMSMTLKPSPKDNPCRPGPAVGEVCVIARRGWLPGFFQVLRYWGPPVAWCVAILLFSGDLGSSRRTLSLFYWLMSWFPHLTPMEVEAWHVWFRKLGHLSAYAILYLLFFRAAHLHLAWRPGHTCLVALALTLGVAITDETRQALVPARSGTPLDVGLDMVGALLAAAVVPGLWRPGRASPTSRT